MKQVTKISRLVAGICAAIAAVFYLVIAIMNLTDLSSQSSGKVNTWFVFGSILNLCLAAALCFIGVMMILGFFKEDKPHWPFCLAGSYLLEVAVYYFLDMCFWGFDNGWAWVLFLFSVIGLVLVVLGGFMKNNILAVAGYGVGVLVVIFQLCNIGAGLIIAALIFALFMMLALTTAGVSVLVNKD